MWQISTTVECRISSRLKLYKNYKNRLRLAKVIVKNKMSRFYGSLCRRKLGLRRARIIDHVGPIWTTVGFMVRTLASSCGIGTCECDNRADPATCQGDGGSRGHPDPLNFWTHWQKFRAPLIPPIHSSLRYRRVVTASWLLERAVEFLWYDLSTLESSTHGPHRQTAERRRNTSRRCRQRPSEVSIASLLLTLKIIFSILTCMCAILNTFDWFI